MSTDTVYRVITKYQVEDKASRGLGDIARRAQAASVSTGALGASIGRLAGLAAGFFGIRQAAGALVGFNDNMEQTKIAMAGLMQINLGGTFEGQFDTAGRLVTELQQKAKVSTSTTAELVGFLRGTIQPLTAAGAKAKDLAEFTDLAVTAAKAFGDESIAELDIQQALTKGIELRDRFGTKLLGVLKMTQEEFKKLDPTQRLAKLTEALRHPAIAAMKKAQETSFSGVTSTFVDNLQLMMGGVGKGLFGAITDEVRQWNVWIDKNQETLTRWGRDFSAALMDGFKFVKGTFEFLVEHRDTLLSLAKAWLVFKGASMAVGVGKGIVGLLSLFSGGLTGVIALLPLMASGISMLIDTWSSGSKTTRTQLEQTFGVERPGSAKDRVKKGITEGFIKGGEVDFEAINKAAGIGKGTFSRSLTNMNKDPEIEQMLGKGMDDSQARRVLMGWFDVTKGSDTALALNNQAQALLDLRGVQVEALTELRNIVASASLLTVFWGEILKAQAVGDKLLARFGKKSDVNVNIHRIEVVSDDPDRFAFRFAENIRDTVRHPGAARRTWREG